ncbi:profilin [Penicillium angulare]|uniref:Profilin n=1 Tax=Penicillium angulare TaxID=116970 RepID=A0A9W9FXP1_9EURO|nr:profilin [Penicillium angulare]
MAIRVDGRSIWGQNGNEAVCVTKTNLAIIVAHNIEGATSTEVATVVEGLAEYIRETGYQ